MPQSPICLRLAKPDDADVLLKLTLDSISISASSHYSTEQLRAWASRCTLDGHRLMILGTTVLVAEIDGVAAGFANLVTENHELDQLYVAPWAGGRGVARRLVQAIEAKAVETGLGVIEARASWRAVEVFDRAGWKRVKTENVTLDDQTMGRVHVRKWLGQVPLAERQ